MERTVHQFINKHQLLDKNTTVLVGVSGGPDSIALLHFLQGMRSQWNLTIVALTANHQLRGKDAQDDITYVQEMCKIWDIPCVHHSLDVPTYQTTHQLSTQVAARELRYEFFAEQMTKHQADYLALGHHGDDQVETMLMSLVRSASSIALSGIPVKRRFATGYIVRPFLCVTKQAIENYCAKFRIQPRIDPSNEDTSYTRNFFRKHIVPIIKKQNHNIHTTMQRLSESLQHDENFIQKEARNVVSDIVTFNQERSRATFDIDRFLKYPNALQRRTYHLILNYLYRHVPNNLSYVHEEDFFALLMNDKSHVQIDFPRHLTVEKSYQRVIFYFQDDVPHHTSFQKVLHVPGKISLPDGSVLHAQYTNQHQVTDKYTYICTVAKDHLPLHIRTRQAGDKMSWKGLNGHKKIKDIFIDAKIPRSKRDTWPIVTTNNGDILWLVGLRKGRHVQTIEKGSLHIKLTFHPSETSSRIGGEADA